MQDGLVAEVLNLLAIESTHEVLIALQDSPVRERLNGLGSQPSVDAMLRRCTAAGLLATPRVQGEPYRYQVSGIEEMLDAGRELTIDGQAGLAIYQSRGVLPVVLELLEGPSTRRELGARIDIAPSTLTYAVRRLRDSGAVQLRRGDKRFEFQLGAGERHARYLKAVSAVAAQCARNELARIRAIDLLCDALISPALLAEDTPSP